MKQMKKLGRFLSSMKFALLLLFLLVGACTAGSLIPQKEIANYYLNRYPGFAGKAVLALGLDDVFHCGWFLVLTALLCLNLLLCNLLHFPQLLRRMRRQYTAGHCFSRWDGTAALTPEEPEALFAGMGFRRVQHLTRDGRDCLYACKHRTGIWGAWLTHLGMLVVILGFGLGQMLQQEYTVYGVPGQTKPIGETGYALTIDDFQVRLREDDTVEQYEAALTVTNTATGEKKSGLAQVNTPLSCFGWKLYQNSTGWAATVDVVRGDELLQSEVICAGEYLSVRDPEGLAVLLRAFYPDYAEDASGSPMTRSGKIVNPAYVYMLYYREAFMGMNVLRGNEQITVDDVFIRFRDPQSYTLIQVKRDAFAWLTAVGAALMTAGLLLAFYLYPAELWAVRQEDGRWAVAGRSAKADAVYQELLKEKGKQLAARNGKGKGE